jgi:transposase
LLERHERGELSQVEASEMLGVPERTFRRWRDRLRHEGPERLRDQRIGKPLSRRAAAEEIVRMRGLDEERYAGLTAKDFHEQLRKAYAITRTQSPARCVALKMDESTSEAQFIQQCSRT